MSSPPNYVRGLNFMMGWGWSIMCSPTQKWGSFVGEVCPAPSFYCVCVRMCVCMSGEGVLLSKTLHIDYLSHWFCYSNWNCFKWLFSKLACFFLFLVLLLLLIWILLSHTLLNDSILWRRRSFMIILADTQSPCALHVDLLKYHFRTLFPSIFLKDINVRVHMQ